MLSWKSVESEGLGFLQLTSLQIPGLVHGVFSRRGGVSHPPYDSLNVSYGVGDQEDAVVENRARIKKSLGLKTLVSARQVHGCRVFTIDEEYEADTEVDGYDALVAAGSNIAIMIQQADCQAVMFYAPDKRVIAIAHAGWRGSVAGIIGATVRIMADRYGVAPELIIAAISPSLGSCCGEFVNYKDELPEWMHAFQVAPNHFDFHAISRAQLVAAGLQEKNISSIPICTRCDPDYFSFRRDQTTGRSTSVIGLV